MIENQKEIMDATDKLVNESVEKIADSEMKKEFIRYALLDEPKSRLGKIVSGVFSIFKDWWVMYKNPSVVKETRESVIEKLNRISAHQIDKENPLRKRDGTVER